FDVHALRATKPPPYRPFKWNKYPITMGIRNVEPSDWFTLDNQYDSVLALRTKRTLDPTYQSTATRPGFHAHALEALCEIASFLSVRFPNLFKVTRTAYVADKSETHGDSIVGKEDGAVVAVHNLITGERFNFKEIERRMGPEWNPMAVAGMLVPDDLAVMVDDGTGNYRLQAGSICTAGTWRLRDKVGKTLDEIHFEGRVPFYAEKLQKSLNRFHQNLKESALIERNNFTFQIGPGLDWVTHVFGDENDFKHGVAPKGGSWHERDESEKAKAPRDVSEIAFRTERQSLRRLPKTRCILFTIRSYMYPILDLADEPGVPGRMASAVRSWPQGPGGVSEFKGEALWGHVLLPFLDKKHAEQVRKGEIVLDERGEMEERYPW
ncbi:hypothetical protein JCM10207_005083, partial [Rhodosporidiobolus poonsookiae]